ncbi:MAG TPA: BON domain-containing protein [Usitatibacter sp.]|nr:BON domain-containing protein [Usitatibacter sp.]
MKAISRSACLAAIPLALALGACSPDNPTNPTMGQRLDNASSNAQDKLAKAGNQIDATADKAANAMKDAASDVREKTAEAGKGLDDAAITASVKTDILKDPDLSVLKIDVDTKDGVVTLNGLASTEAAKTRAERLAYGVKGVKEVHNLLTVKAA